MKHHNLNKIIIIKNHQIIFIKIKIKSIFINYEIITLLTPPHEKLQLGNRIGESIDSN